MSDRCHKLTRCQLHVSSAQLNTKRINSAQSSVITCWSRIHRFALIITNSATGALSSMAHLRLYRALPFQVLTSRSLQQDHDDNDNNFIICTMIVIMFQLWMQVTRCAAGWAGPNFSWEGKQKSQEDVFLRPVTLRVLTGLESGDICSCFFSLLWKWQIPGATPLISKANFAKLEPGPFVTNLWYIF